MAPKLRKTRIVCVSDTHNANPQDGAFKLPKGDVLIHAGDFTNQGTYSEINKALTWILQSDYEAKIVIAGNHEKSLDPTVSDLEADDQALKTRDSHAALQAATQNPSFTYLNHSAALIKLTSPEGPRTSFTVFGSPFSPQDGPWGFSYTPEQASALWQKIPSQTDIVITHTPSKGLCDESPTRGGAAGCEVLRQRLSEVRPMLAVCGHVHEARGVKRVRWDLLDGDGDGEAQEWVWRDPGEGNKKQSLVDLTGKRETRLENGSAVEGRAGDRETVGREETCVINAAIMASSWPHKGKDGKKYNKPIVVDVDLPTWEDDEIFQERI